MCVGGVDALVAHQAFDGDRVPGFSFRVGRPADTLGVEHRFQIYDGGHGWKHWAPVIEEALRYALAEAPPAAPGGV